MIAATVSQSLGIQVASRACAPDHLPGEHRDPFDRLIAAQALIEDLTVVTRDREIAAFGCKVLW